VEWGEPQQPLREKKARLFRCAFQLRYLADFLGLYEKERGKDLENTLRQFAGWCVINHIRPKGPSSRLAWGYSGVGKKFVPRKNFEATVQKRVKKNR